MPGQLPYASIVCSFSYNTNQAFPRPHHQPRSTKSLATRPLSPIHRQRSSSSFDRSTVCVLFASTFRKSRHRRGLRDTHQVTPCLTTYLMSRNRLTRRGHLGAGSYNHARGTRFAPAPLRHHHHCMSAPSTCTQRSSNEAATKNITGTETAPYTTQPRRIRSKNSCAGISSLCFTQVRRYVRTREDIALATTRLEPFFAYKGSRMEWWGERGWKIRDIFAERLGNSPRCI